MEQLICLPRIASREQLAALRSNPALGVRANVVYVYFLFDKLFPYPKGNSNVLYIGEAMRETEPTGVRFRQHITPSACNGADTGSNFVLSQYFHAGWEIGLSVFSTNEERTDRERDLIYAHISLYGAPPIAQGKIPHDSNGRNRTTHIAAFIDNNAQAISAGSQVLMNIVATHGLTTHSTRPAQNAAQAV
jgi:hypothetical protein